jgi:hypothetical protein
MINPKKISILVAIGVILIAVGISFLFISITTPVPESVNRHHFQVMVNDTFGIGEKRNLVSP